MHLLIRDPDRLPTAPGHSTRRLLVYKESQRSAFPLSALPVPPSSPPGTGPDVSTGSAASGARESGSPALPESAAPRCELAAASADRSVPVSLIRHTYGAVAV